MLHGSIAKMTDTGEVETIGDTERFHMLLEKPVIINVPQDGASDAISDQLRKQLASIGFPVRTPVLKDYKIDRVEVRIDRLSNRIFMTPYAERIQLSSFVLVAAGEKLLLHEQHHKELSRVIPTILEEVNANSRVAKIIAAWEQGRGRRSVC